jgi:DNA-binding transcriptional ArsR family regulator
MSKGVGKALERAIVSKKEKIQGEIEHKDVKFEFMNKNRQEIFQFLCLHPCCYTSMMSRATKLSLHTINWHLRRLLDAGYISKAEPGKRTVFYPKEMVSLKDIPIFKLLNTDRAKSIYILIAENNGIFQGEICNKLGLKHQAVIWYSKKLESLKLISSFEDGKYRRYYPTELLHKKKDESSMRMKLFREWLVNKFQRENLSPTILRTTEDKFVVRIKRGGTKAVLTLHTNPFVTVLS